MATKTAKTKKILCIFFILTVLLSALTSLVSCGEDLTAQKEEIQKKYAEMSELSNDLTEALNILQDGGVELNPDYVAAYNDAVDFMKEVGELDMNGKSKAELDDLLETVDTLLNAVKNARTAVSAEMDEQLG